MQRALTTAIASAAPALDERTVRLCAQSFLAQLVHVLHAERFAPSEEDAADHLEPADLVDHIVRFTLAALDRLQETQP